MNFWDKLQANVGAWLDGTTVAAQQAESDRLDAAIDRENAADAERYGPVWQEQVAYNQTRDERTYRQDVGEEIESGFEEGWQEGRDNVTEFGQGVGTVIGDVAGSAAQGVAAGAWETFKKNWWWMIPALAVAFVWFGGLRLLPKRKGA